MTAKGDAAGVAFDDRTFAFPRPVSRMHIAIVSAAVVAACVRPAPAPAPRPADIEGTVIGVAYERLPGGKGGLARINVQLDASQARYYSRVNVWIDSLTRFEGAYADFINWAMPQPRHASVRVWFRGEHTTPVNGETYAKADVVSLDSMPSVDSGAFVVTLGRDTVAAEAFERAGNRISGQIVRRIPRTTVVTYELSLAPSGQPRMLEFRTQLPDGTQLPNGSRSIAVWYRADSAITEFRREPPVRRAAAAPSAFPEMEGSVLFFWLPVKALRARSADSMAFHSLEPGAPTAQHTAVARRDDRRYWVYYFQLPMEVVVDDQGAMQSIDGSRTTFRIAATRLPHVDLRRIAAAFAERERTVGPLIALSPPDSAIAEVGDARITVRYGRPSARGRAIWSERGVLGDTLWRTGANASTRLVTTAELSFGGRPLPAGTYVVTTLAIPGRYQLILSDGGREVLRVPLAMRVLPARVEQFTIRVEATGAGGGRIALQWDDRELIADFVAPKRAS
jgi:hypothetical protein